MIDAETKLKMDFKDIGGDMDGGTSVALVKRHHDHTIFDILKAIGCTFDNRASNVPDVDKRYRGSGLASYYRSSESKSLCVTIDVGCWCSHDCCGHMCYLGFEISLTDSYYVIIKTVGYNC